MTYTAIVDGETRSLRGDNPSDAVRRDLYCISRGPFWPKGKENVHSLDPDLVGRTYEVYEKGGDEVIAEVKVTGVNN